MFKGDPFKQKGCPYDRKCAVGNKAVCTQQRTIYQLVCLICKEEGGEDRRDGNRRPQMAVYRGQSGHTSHKRCLEHLDSIRRGILHLGWAPTSERHIQK